MSTLNSTDNTLNDLLNTELKKMGIKIPTQPEIKIDDVTTVREETVDMNSRFIMQRKIYEQTLAPQLIKNEKLKRNLKQSFVDKIFKILKWQFSFTYIFVLALIVGSVNYSV